jgi:glutamate transport system permease protein
MSAASVLYDVPGPRARRRNAIASVLFVVVLLLVVWVVYRKLDDKNELAAAKWKPFTTGDVWSQFLLPGLLATLKAAALSMVIALPLGMMLAVGRLSDHRWLRWPCVVIVEFFRAVPVLLMMVFAKEAYFTWTSIDIGTLPLLSVVTGLVLYNASVLAEVFRAGILALPRGQTEAAQALGLRKRQIMTSVLLPQATAAMLPAIVSQLVVVLKDTALGGQLLVAYDELLRQGALIPANYGNSVATYTVIAVIFVVLNLTLSQLARGLEAYLRRRGMGGRGVRLPLPGTVAADGTPAAGPTV